MSTFHIEIEESTVRQLVALADWMGIPAQLPIEERLSQIILVLADHADANVGLVDYESDGEPLQLDAAVEAVLSPSIATDFTPPKEQAPAVRAKLSLNDIMQLGGMHGKHVEDPVMAQAVEVVYNNIDRSDWDSALSDRLVEETAELIRTQVKKGGE